LVISDGPNQTGPTLFVIDPQTLGITSKALMGADRLIGSGFVGGILYGFSESGQIVTINTATGVETVVAHYDSGQPPGGGPPFTGIFGVVGTPEPGTLFVTLAGLFLVAGGLRSKRLARCDKRD
jgi:hypothetical protein